MAVRLFDTHVHLDHERFREDRDAVLARAAEAGVLRMVQASYDLDSSQRSCTLARQYNMPQPDRPRIWCAVGIHPHDADSLDEEALKKLRSLLDRREDNRIVAIGEIGLDYHYDLSPREQQRKAFALQLELAQEYRLPVILHDREAHEDCLRILVSAGVREGKPAGLGGEPGHPGVFHCYSGSPETAQQILNMGFFLGFDGPVTFKNAKKTPEVVKMTPPDRILIETDCPFLAPEPYRGKRNEPSYVTAILGRIADLLSCSIEEAAQQTWDNAGQLFRIADGD